MGSLKPGAKYIYERVDGKVYAREFGDDPSTKTLIGYDYEQEAFERSIHSEDDLSRKYSQEYRDWKIWYDVIQTSKDNPALKKILENAIMMYRLIKDNPK